MRVLWITLLVSTAILLPSSADWPRFRGPTGDGIYPARADDKPHGFPTKWSEDENEQPEPLILSMDGIDVQYLVALDRETGKTVWKTDRNTDFGDVEAGGKIRGDGKIHVTSELGILSRIDAATGEFEDRLSLNARFTASGVYADGLIFYPSEAGDTVIVQPGADMKIVATNTLDDGCMASPALDGSSIFLRTRSHVYRIGK